MKLLERILVPTDFSPVAEDAVRTAIFVAKQFNSEICLLHVMPGTVDFCSDHQDLFTKKVDDRLAEIAEQIRAEGIQDVKTVVDHGVPFDLIDQHAMKRNVNVIIMGAGNLVDGGPFRLGTTAGRLRRKAAKPVWIVKPNTSPQINRVLCPVDCSTSSGRALKNAIHLSRAFPAELTVLTVVHCVPEHYEGFVEDTAKVDKVSAQKQLPQFEKFLETFDFNGVSWKKEIRYGKPYREIVTVAQETKSDLLVMGSVGRTAFARILVGGVAKKVTRELPCSIATVKSEHAIQLRLDEGHCNLEACLKQGRELLEHGFPEEALSHFERCVAKDMMRASAWEAMAAAHQRLNQPEKAEDCKEKAKSIVQYFSDRLVEADIRSRHPFFGRNRQYRYR